MKVVNLKQAILQAWKERWSDYQWAINMKKFFPKGATWDILNLADALLEQAMIGPSPNPLILSYLKYAISSQMVSYSSVLTAISKFDDFSRDLLDHKPSGHPCVRPPQPRSSLTSEELSRRRVCVCVCV
uniref:Mediator of RNA polymerase II transcription subunit 24 n=1 Tax=Colobus angolensis palliatus TaxID=336983 RepID=A0A2K5KEA4_COLAP